MISAERVIAYSKLESEALLKLDSSDHPGLLSQWPNEGVIEVVNLSYRHYPDGPLVLKGLTFSIHSQEKVQF